MGAWAAIPYVGNGLSLISFVMAVLLFIYRSRNKSRVELVKNAPSKDRIKVIAAESGFLLVNTERVPANQLRDIVLKQIEQRTRRELLLGILAIVFCIVAGTVSTITIIYDSHKNPIPQVAIQRPETTLALQPQEEIRPSEWDIKTSFVMPKEASHPAGTKSSSLEPSLGTTNSAKLPQMQLAPDEQLPVRCNISGDKAFGQQICNQLESYRDTFNKLGKQIGASGIEVSITSEQSQSNVFSGSPSSKATSFDAHWTGVARPHTVISLSSQETGNAWNVAQEFAQRLQNSTPDVHQ